MLHLKKEESAGTMSKEIIEREMMSYLMDHVWERIGRPTWFIHPDMIPFLEGMKAEANVEDVFIPHDAMCFVFPHGTKSDGVPCRNVLTYFPRSESTLDLTNEFLGHISRDADRAPVYDETDKNRYLEDSTVKLIYFVPDFGVQMDGSHSLDLMSPQLSTFSFKSNQSVHDAISSKFIDREIDGVPLNDEEVEDLDESINYVSSMVIKALLYVQAVRSEGLDTSPRPRLKQKKRKKGRRPPWAVTLPPWESVVKPTKELLDLVVSDGSEGQGDRSSPRPHFRGGCLRTLRHERYKRNDDGSCRVILVKPSLVRARKVEDIPTTTKGGEELLPQ
jgi:hypothetical protein